MVRGSCHWFLVLVGQVVGSVGLDCWFARLDPNGANSTPTHQTYQTHPT